MHSPIEQPHSRVRGHLSASALFIYLLPPVLCLYSSYFTMSLLLKHSSVSLATKALLVTCWNSCIFLGIIAAFLHTAVIHGILPHTIVNSQTLLHTTALLDTTVNYNYTFTRGTLTSVRCIEKSSLKTDHAVVLEGLVDGNVHAVAKVRVDIGQRQKISGTDKEVSMESMKTKPCSYKHIKTNTTIIA